MNSPRLAAPTTIYQALVTRVYSMDMRSKVIKAVQGWPTGQTNMNVGLSERDVDCLRAMLSVREGVADRLVAEKVEGGYKLSLPGAGEAIADIVADYREYHQMKR